MASRRHRRGSAVLPPAVTLSPSPRLPRRRYRRRRWGGPLGKPIAALPEGAQVFTFVKIAEKMPASWRGRHRWVWASITGVKNRRRIIFHLDGAEISAAISDCYVKTLSGDWRRVCAAGHTTNMKYWWAHNTETKLFRLATVLEVALYMQNEVGAAGVNFVPHPGWRLVDENREFVGAHMGDLTSERVYLARPEPPSDEEWADRLEEKKSKRKVKQLTHARKMLAMWRGKEKVVASRIEKWAKAVGQLELKVEGGRGPKA